MKILHTADWHLGKQLGGFSRLDEQREVLEEICYIAEEQKVDAVLIAGDLFDTYNPTAEAVELFYKVLKKLSSNGKRAVIAIAGNHDSPERIEAPDPLARECGIIFAGFPNSHITQFQLESGLCLTKSQPGFVELKLPKIKFPLRILMTPYANEYRLKTFLGLENAVEEMRQILQTQWQQLAHEYCDNQGVNILLAHLFVMKKDSIPAEEPEEEKPILHIGGAQAVHTENIPTEIQYVALGHLHAHLVIDSNPCPIIYSSSPLSYSFSEADQDKYVVIVDVEPDQSAKLSAKKLTKGKRLHRKRFDDIDNALQWLKENPHTLVELTLVAEDFLTANDRKRLQRAHEGIVTIIPEIKNSGLPTTDKKIDLSQDVEKLFVQYFKDRHEQEPNKELLELFKEIRSEQIEE